eukprot:5155883-Pyramimonas_sp.AAC.1
MARRNASRPCTRTAPTRTTARLAVIQNVATDMPELTKTKRVDLMEVCCPETSALGQTVLSQGGPVVRCGLFNGYDMATTGLRRAVHLLRRTRP